MRHASCLQINQSALSFRRAAFQISTFHSISPLSKSSAMICNSHVVRVRFRRPRGCMCRDGCMRQYLGPPLCGYCVTTSGEPSKQDKTYGNVFQVEWCVYSIEDQSPAELGHVFRYWCFKRWPQRLVRKKKLSFNIVDVSPEDFRKYVCVVRPDHEDLWCTMSGTTYNISRRTEAMV